MSVIITNMGMPKSCSDCERGNICGYGYGYSRSNDCPLKSVYDLRKEVLEYIDDLDTANEICDVFDKYCNKENKDGSN